MKRGDQRGFEAALVVNNHYDTDGVLSVFALLEPAAALAHEALLVAAAAAGDFDEWPEESGIKLNAALVTLEARGGGSDDAAYRHVLPQVYCDGKAANREITGLALGDREWLLNDGQIQNPSVQS